MFFTRQSYIHSIVDQALTEHPFLRSELDHKDPVRVGKTWLNDWFLAPMGQLHLCALLASYYKPPPLVLKEYFVSCEQVTTFVIFLSKCMVEGTEFISNQASGE